MPLDFSQQKATFMPEDSIYVFENVVFSFHYSQFHIFTVSISNSTGAYTMQAIHVLSASFSSKRKLYCFTNGIFSFKEQTRKTLIYLPFSKVLRCRIAQDVTSPTKFSEIYASGCKKCRCS